MQETFKAILITDDERQWLELRDEITNQIAHAFALPRFWHERQIFCSGCGCGSPMGRNLVEARQKARERGWQYARERLGTHSNTWTYSDYCPRCREKGNANE